MTVDMHVAVCNYREFDADKQISIQGGLIKCINVKCQCVLYIENLIYNCDHLKLMCALFLKKKKMNHNIVVYKIVYESKETTLC